MVKQLIGYLQNYFCNSELSNTSAWYSFICVFRFVLLNLIFNFFLQKCFAFLKTGEIFPYHHQYRLLRLHSFCTNSVIKEVLVKPLPYYCQENNVDMFMKLLGVKFNSKEIMHCFVTLESEVIYTFY